jgi:hypothetical protein
MKRDLINEACPHCGKPVYADEGYHTVALSHYKCEDAREERLKEAIKKMDSVFSDFGIKKKRKREGDGQIAQKVLKMATEAFEREAKVRVVRSTLWNQKGGYRGKYWDLARWGINFEFVTEDGLLLHGSVHSWATMTQCAKADKMKLHKEDSPFEYSV